MIQPLKRYPDESINVNSGPVRSFKDSYKDMVQDLIDTATEHNLEALSAVQIGYPYALFIIKEDDGSYKAYANARIINQKEPFNSSEKCSYFFDIPITVKRFEKLSTIYDDENGEMQTLKIEDKEKAAKFQRMVDFVFNTSLLDRLKPEQRDQAVKALAGKGHMPDLESCFCPTDSKKDYFISVIDKLLFFMFISLWLPLFNISKETPGSWYTYDKIATVSIIILLIGFFFYAQYEAKKYKQCTSCQIGNQIGIMIKRLVALIPFAIASYFIVNPN